MKRKEARLLRMYDNHIKKYCYGIGLEKTFQLYLSMAPTHSTHLTGIAIMHYVVYNITSTQVAPLTPAMGSSFLNEFRAAAGSVKQMLGRGGGGEEGRGPSAVLSLFVSCSLSRLFWQANASKVPSILFSADPELLKVKHMGFRLPSRYCTTH